jgi:hypothetical protein
MDFPQQKYGHVRKKMVKLERIYLFTVNPRNLATYIDLGEIDQT